MRSGRPSIAYQSPPTVITPSIEQIFWFFEAANYYRCAIIGKCPWILLQNHQREKWWTVCIEVCIEDCVCIASYMSNDQEEEIESMSVVSCLGNLKLLEESLSLSRWLKDRFREFCILINTCTVLSPRGIIYLPLLHLPLLQPAVWQVWPPVPSV